MVAVCVAMCMAGCTPTYVPEDRADRRERILNIDSHVGGTHYRTLVQGEYWFQAFANQVLVLSPVDGRTIAEVAVHPWGQGGAVVDMAIDGTTLWAVTDRTALTAVDIRDPTQVVVGESFTAHDLGIEPRHVSLAGGEVWVSGDGGVVRLRDRARFLTGEPVARVVQTPAGPAATVRRRIVMVEDGRYIGAASDLQPLPPGFGPSGGYVFHLQGANSAHAGLMSPAFTEIASVAISGALRRVRVVGDSLVLVTDTTLEFWKFRDGALVEPTRITLKGARDLDLLKPNHLAVAGTFGRAMLRLHAEGTLPGDTFYNVHREPGLLEMAVTDSRRILAGGREGFWLWRVGGEATLSDRTVDITSITPRMVAAAWGTATILPVAEPDSHAALEVEFKHDGAVARYSPDAGARITTLALVDGDVWVGHERGLDVLRRMAPGTLVEGEPLRYEGGNAGSPHVVSVIHRFRFEGPVLFIFPERLGGGAAIVSLHGGFALLKPVPVGELPTFEGRGTIK